MKVGDKNVQELREKLLKEEESGRRRWVLCRAWKQLSLVIESQ